MAPPEDPPVDEDLLAVLERVRHDHLRSPPTLIDDGDDGTYALDGEVVDLEVDGVTLTDLSGVMYFVTPSWARLHGTTVQEMIGRSLASLHTADQLRREHEPFMERLRRDGHHEGEVGHRRADGALQPLWRSAHQLVDIDGQPTGLLMISRALDQRRPEPVRDGAGALLGAIPDGIAELEPVRDGAGRVTDLRFLSHNPAFAAMVGLDDGEADGRTILELLPDTEPDWIAACAQVSADGAPVRIESFSSTLGVDLEVTAFRPAAGRVACIFEDITGRPQRLEPPDQLVAELQAVIRRLTTSAEQERSSVARVLEDRLRHHLSVLGMKLGMVQAMLDQGDTVQVSNLVDNAINQIGEMSQTAQALLNRLRPGALDSKGLHAALSQIAERFSMSTSMLVLMEGAPLSRPLEPAVEMSLYRITEEALENAAEHAGASRVQVALEQRSSAVVLTIQDDGVGFSPTKPLPSPPNRGLGLVTMRERAAAIGGTLQVDAAPGQGARVIVTVPLT